MNDQSLALLINRLELPLVVRDLMEQEGVLASDMGYTLHVVLSDMRPDTALLAIAATAQMLVGGMKNPSPGDAVLHGLCARVIEDYAPRWMATYGNEDAVQDFLLEIFGRVESDLLSLHDLLKTASALQKDEKIAKILNVLEIQSRAQADVVSEFLNLMECEFMQGETLFPAEGKLVFSDMDDEEYSDFEMDVCRYGTPGRLKASASSASTRNIINFPVYY
ncbi:MAG: hypothetical protein LRZ85_10450 [Alphaproteobacteria bacterium]|nr:hypothetical protein [Alphaproteobacteria bacterium]MCD8571387.1 hypothetical protein [Alphaproteobacteria bacterium]